MIQRLAFFFALTVSAITCLNTYTPRMPRTASCAVEVRPGLWLIKQVNNFWTIPNGVLTRELEKQGPIIAAYAVELWTGWRVAVPDKPALSNKAGDLYLCAVLEVTPATFDMATLQFMENLKNPTAELRLLIEFLKTRHVESIDPEAGRING